MQFTEKQKQIIDRLLSESDEEQIKNGNITYTQEEMTKIFSMPREERKLYFHNL